jgi:integrase/recombinase XerD
LKSLELKNRSFIRIHANFKQMMFAKGYAQNGHSHYPACVKEFLCFIENMGKRQIKLVTSGDLNTYFIYLQKRPNQRHKGYLSDSSIRGHLLSIRLLFMHLVDSGKLKGSPIYVPRFRVQVIKKRFVLKVNQVKEIFAACTNKRERAILSLAYGCGLRRSEITRLNSSDVLLDKGLLTIRLSKTGRQRMVPLADKVIKDLSDYSKIERKIYLKKGFCPAFIVNNVGTRMTGLAMNTYLKKIVANTQNKKIAKKPVTLHCLRHSFATHLLDNGAELDFVRKVLGHSYMDSTHWYSVKRKFKKISIH